MARIDSYEQRVAEILAALGIPASYGKTVGWTIFPEAVDLTVAGPDIYGRAQRMTPPTAAAWHAIKAAAESEGVKLLLVSAFRSLDEQKRIFERKLAAGQALEQILRVNAPPGYSEHHTGRAVDIATEGVEPLAEEFEKTTAFEWLARRAGDFGFRMTYPRGNRFGIAYEPWHWTFQKS